MPSLTTPLSITLIRYTYQLHYTDEETGLMAVHKLSDPEVGICIQEGLRPCEEGDLAKQPSISRDQAQVLLLPNSRLRFSARIIQTSQPHPPLGTRGHLTLLVLHSLPPQPLLLHSVSEHNPVWLCVVAVTSSPGLGVASPVTNTLLTIASVQCHC